MTGNIKTVLDSKYESILRLKNQKLELLETSLLNKEFDTSKEWETKYLKTKLQLREIKTKDSRTKAEIQLLERIYEQSSRLGNKQINKQDWEIILRKLSQLPNDENSLYDSSYFMDLYAVWKQKKWLLPFPELLQVYLQYSPANKPKNPFSFTKEFAYENSSQLESISKQNLSSSKKNKASNSEHKNTHENNDIKNKPKSTEKLNSKLKLDAFKNLGFSKKNHEPDLDISTGVSMDLVPTKKAYSLPPPKLKKVIRK